MRVRKGCCSAYAKLLVEIPSSVVRQPPQVPGGDATEGTPAPGPVEECLRGGALRQAIQEANTLLDAKISCGHDVQPPELEDEEHLCRPFSDPPNGREATDDLGVVVARDPPEIQLSMEDLPCQVADGLGLAPGQSGLEKPLLRKREHLIRRRETWSGAEPPHTSVNCGRGLGG